MGAETVWIRTLLKSHALQSSSAKLQASATRLSAGSQLDEYPGCLGTAFNDGETAESQCHPSKSHKKINNKSWYTNLYHYCSRISQRDLKYNIKSCFHIQAFIGNLMITSWSQHWTFLSSLCVCLHDTRYSTSNTGLRWKSCEAMPMLIN